MKSPAPIWTTEYARDRWAERPRCRCCNRILEIGNSVLMARAGVGDRAVIHTECGEKQHGTAAWTWADAMAYWGTEHLIACGWKLTLPAQPASPAA